MTFRKPQRRAGGSAPIADILSVCLSKHGLKREYMKWQIFALWERAVGPQIAEHTECVRLEQGVLTIGVAHTAWMQELQFMKQEIVDRLNREIHGLAPGEQLSLEHTSIKSLKFMLGKKRPQQPKPALPAAAETLAALNPSPQDRSEAEQITGAIEDSELRLMLQKLYLTSKKTLDR